ncbi:MAG: hypothetical protein ACRC0B_06125 [Legionella sp.]
MPTYADFFKQFNAMAPRFRQQNITPAVWAMLADLGDTTGFRLKLIGLINTCPASVGFILEQLQKNTYIFESNHGLS